MLGLTVFSNIEYGWLGRCGSVDCLHFVFYASVSVQVMHICNDILLCLVAFPIVFWWKRYSYMSTKCVNVFHEFVCVGGMEEHMCLCGLC